jgi:hypothetical protein
VIIVSRLSDDENIWFLKGAQFNNDSPFVEVRDASTDVDMHYMQSRPRVGVPNRVGLSRGGRGWSPGSSSECARLRNQNVDSRVAALEMVSASRRDGIASTGAISNSDINMNSVSLLWGPLVRVVKLGGTQY